MYFFYIILHFILKRGFFIINAVLSTLAAIASAYVAYRTYNYLENKDTKEFEKDLYGVTTHLVGVYYYLENLYNVHSTVDTEITMNLITNIKNTDKNIIDTTNQFFFNSNFTTNVNTNLSYFIKSYIEWRGYKILNETDIFIEARKICIVKNNILEALKTILTDYKNDKKIESIIALSLYDINIRLDKTLEEINKTTYIYHNLNFLFFSESINQYQYDKAFVTAYFFKCFFSIKPIPENISHTISFLFQKEIVKENINKRKFFSSEEDAVTVNDLIFLFNFQSHQKTGHA